jgi:hypothetical protein
LLAFGLAIECLAHLAGRSFTRPKNGGVQVANDQKLGCLGPVVLADSAELGQPLEGLLPGQDDEVAGERYMLPVELVAWIGLGVGGLCSILSRWGP